MIKNSSKMSSHTSGGSATTAKHRKSRDSSDSEDESYQAKPKSKSKKSEGKKTPEKKSYRCDRCNFSSSSKAKYTKHAKSAHSGTVVQCDHCEFKTPYKWNLDRHYKNHLGGGALCCHLCNFSCDIKQSLTVHLQNHHTNVPEEIIESVKRQQVPSRHHKETNANNNSSSSGTSSATASTAASSATTAVNNNVENSRSASPTDGEKKVPPLRISRSLTGLSFGDEGSNSKKEDESSAGVAPFNNEILDEGDAADEKLNQRKCDLCDFEVSGEGGSSLLKKHMASQHGVHHKSSKHKDHKKRAPSSSPERKQSQPSSSLLIPILSLPLKKGASTPKLGAPAETMSPSVNRSQSPLKASEAVTPYADVVQDSSEAGIQSQSASPPSGAQNILSSATLQSTCKIEASIVVGATPVQEFSSSPLSHLKKPKQRALASFYEKINQKLSSGGKPNNNTTDVPAPAEVATATTLKSNRCQYCRQRCKSSVDLATHLEKCPDAQPIKKKENGGEGDTKQQKLVPDVKVAEVALEDEKQIAVKTTPGVHSPCNTSTTSSTSHTNMEVDESEDGEGEGKVLNGTNDNDGLIGFETAPGVGSIHTGKMDEIEYQGYKAIISASGKKDDAQEEINGLQSSPRGEDDDDGIGDGRGTKTNKSMITTRKVYRCPEADCTFWATTASRFHVHIVGHYNLKPFECSECHYKSNWRWDVNKHIRLKTPKDSKHGKAKTLLTHESGQRDYRKYDNYLVTMALTHSANAKAPDCSTVASKRTKNGVATPKSSPELSAPSQKDLEGIHSSNTTSGDVSQLSSSGKQKLPKLTKAPATSSSSSTGSNSSGGSVTLTPEAGGSYGQNIITHEEDIHPADLASSSSSPGGGSKGEGRSFVETRMHAGGEIYQTNLMDQNLMMSNDGVKREEMEVDGGVPYGVDLTLKRAHPHEDSMKGQEMVLETQMPTKKSRMQKEFTVPSSDSGATNEGKILSMWQCIKCSFKHSNKDMVSSHIREVHKPKKGDPVSILTHNHLIQVMIPEQDAASLLGDGVMYSLPLGQKKADVEQMYDENGRVLSCKHCPFTTGLLYEMEIHAEHHFSKSNSYYSCPHCSYSVPVKSELHEHLKLHGDMPAQSKPHEIQNRIVNSSTMISSTTDSKQAFVSPTSTTEVLSMKKPKKYQCRDCPYGTNSLVQFQYHTQSHEPRDNPFKCHRCSFNVTVKLHLLQHLRVHGIQIDDVGIIVPQPEYNDEGEDMNLQQPDPDEPLNLSIFANRKPVVVWDANGTAMEMYRCQVCPQVFPDLNELREHELVTNHRRSNTSSANSRQCDSPPCEAVNLSLKPSSKKSSQSIPEVSTPVNRSVNTSAPNTSSSTIPLLSPTLNVESAISPAAVPSSKAERESLFLCDECPARFFFEKELKIHHTFHENKSTFQCPKCSYSARQKDPHLMSHMRVHGPTYQDKTKALLHRFPKTKVNFGSASAVANLSATLLGSSLLNPTYLQAAVSASTVSSIHSKLKTESITPDQSNLDGMRKNGLSIVCPKCPEKFYSPAAYQQHISFHGNTTDFRCRFCDYYAHSRKGLTIHELVHAGAEIATEATVGGGNNPAGKTSSSAALNTVSMMALIAHQDAAFAASSNSSITPELDNIDKNAPVPEEAYEGNPEFVYPTYMKNGRVKSKRYKCLKCPSAFEKKDQYHTHIGLHGSNQKYKCTICDYAVTYYANYIQHLKKHENQRNIPAELLNPKILVKKGSLLMEEDEGSNGSGSIANKFSHVGGDTGGNSPISNGSVDSNGHQSLIKCTFCPFQCLDEFTFEAHVIHHQDNPNWLHICTVCNFKTSSKKALKEHAKLHLQSSFQDSKYNGQYQKLNFYGKKAGFYNEKTNDENGEINGVHHAHQQLKVGGDELEGSFNESL